VTADMHMHFLGLEGDDSAYERSHIVVLPVPYEYTVTFGRGAGRGPEALITASTQIERYDEYFGAEVWRPALHTRPPLPVNATPEQLVERVQAEVKLLLDDGKTPLLLGGEHTISLGAVLACSERFPDLTVLSIDAHADLRDSYEGRALSHATVMRRICEHCPVVLAAVRSISSEEIAFLNREGSERVQLFFRHQSRPLSRVWDELRSALSPHVYVSLDVDALDLGLMPACGTPEPGGLDWFELTELFEKVSGSSTIIGADVVEFAPPPENITIGAVAARIVLRVIGFLARCTRQ